MKVWKLILVTQYLGNGVEACGYKEINKPESVEIGKDYYDKMGNQQANFVYLDNLRDVDEVYLRMYRKVKERHGRKNLPDHAFKFYKESFDRALKNYPEAIL
jgi:hypothetical protein